MLAKYLSPVSPLLVGMIIYFTDNTLAEELQCSFGLRKHFLWFLDFSRKLIKEFSFSVYFKVFLVELFVILIDYFQTASKTNISALADTLFSCLLCCAFHSPSNKNWMKFLDKFEQREDLRQGRSSISIF